MIKPIEKNFQLATAAAVLASEKIIEFYQKGFEKQIKNDGSPLTEADLASSSIIAEQLKDTNIPIIGEELEKAPYSVRKEWKRCWCVDPLDGTKEFIKKNGEFVVNIALIEHGKPVFGIVASPISKKMILGGKALGTAYLIDFKNINNTDRWKKIPQLNKKNSPLVVISSRSHYSGDLLVLIKQLEEKYGKTAAAQMGSALKFFDLSLGKADVYPRLAPTMEWDTAAGQAIYEVIGGEVLDYKTQKPLTYNKENLLNPFFIAKKRMIYL